MSSLFSAPIEGKTYMKLKEIQTLTVQLFSLRPRFKLPVYWAKSTSSLILSGHPESSGNHEVSLSSCSRQHKETIIGILNVT